MNNARRAFFIALCCALCACGGPSLQYKKDVSSMMAHGNFEGAQAKIESSKTEKGFVLKSEKNPDLQKNLKPDSQGD